MSHGLIEHPGIARGDLSIRDARTSGIIHCVALTSLMTGDSGFRSTRNILFST